MIAFLLTAAIVGVVVTIFLPFASEQIQKFPALNDLMQNKLVQILVIGAITVIGIAVFMAIARSLKLKPRMG
jgi:hypothetical protein